MLWVNNGRPSCYTSAKTCAAPRLAIVKRMKADLSRLPRAAMVYIHELETGLTESDARINELTKRLDVLEEQYRLALARQCRKSEKRKDRVFNEVEQAADAEPVDDDGVPILPDTGLPDLE